MLRAGWVVFVLAAPPAWAAGFTSATAPEFAGHVTASLIAPDGPPPDVSTWTLQSNGVTFEFTTQGTVPGDLLIDAGPPDVYEGIISYDNPPEQEGVTVVITPAVAAVGFDGYGILECPEATFVGVTGSDVLDVATQGGNCYNTSHFFGAAGTGGIGTVQLRGADAIFTVQTLYFVPPEVDAPDADLVLTKTAAASAVSGDALGWSLSLDSFGPDAAPDVVVADLLPPGIVYGSATSTSGTVHEDDHDGDLVPDVIRVVESSLPIGPGFDVTIGADAPARDVFTCGSVVVNVAIAASGADDPDLSDNVAFTVTTFDEAAVAGATEICDNGIDDDCDGDLDCGAPGCLCRPVLPPAPDASPECAGAGIIQGLDDVVVVTTCPSEGNAAENHACTVPRGACGGVTVPAFCCDPGFWSDPANNLNMGACDVGVPGCVPRDPNWKDADPGVNLWGYGYTAAAEPITYTIHYENVGDADAHDVVVIDALDVDLDAPTVTGGTWDATTRTITWLDPVVPPHTPRSVSFTAAVRSDATPGTRVRNVATVVFPDAVPPTRIDTNFVEHVVPSPEFDDAPVLSLDGCVETSPGSGIWHVRLLNDGPGFAYDVTAEIADAPASIDDARVAFGHPDDGDTLRAVIPYAVTTSLDTIETRSDADPCAELPWVVTWHDAAGNAETIELGDVPEGGCNCVTTPGGCGWTCNQAGHPGLPGLLAALLTLRRRRSA